MNRTYKATRALLFTMGESAEHEHKVEIHYEVAFGTPESGRNGRPEDYDPGSPDECDITRLFSLEPGSLHDALPQWMFKLLAEDDYFLRNLVAEARDDEVAAADDAAELRHDERRMETGS